MVEVVHLCCVQLRSSTCAGSVALVRLPTAKGSILIPVKFLEGQTESPFLFFSVGEISEGNRKICNDYEQVSDAYGTKHSNFLHTWVRRSTRTVTVVPYADRGVRRLQLSAAQVRQHRGRGQQRRLPGDERRRLHHGRAAARRRRRSLRPPDARRKHLKPERPAGHGQLQAVWDGCPLVVSRSQSVWYFHDSTHIPLTATIFPRSSQLGRSRKTTRVCKVCARCFFFFGGGGPKLVHMLQRYAGLSWNLFRPKLLLPLHFCLDMDWK